MVSRSRAPKLARNPGVQLALVTLAAMLVLAYQTTRVQDFVDLWLTADQQGWLAMRDREWETAVNRFENPGWQGVAAYRGGLYEASADSFGRIATAEGHFNRGVALVRGRDYRNAISAFELALEAAPDWLEAQENLELARYVLEYLERTREQSDTGQQEDLGPDDIRFDNEDQRGQEVEIDRSSTIGLESAEKWMRSVDTDTADFLRSRFQLEARRAAAP
ncbi:MAG: tetratricopeptide repeat protein [Gammaproteobacteria bacterium]|jgi:Ca-activated chloride channel family protein